MKSFESSQAEKQTYSIHVEGDPKRFPRGGNVKMFSNSRGGNIILGEGKLNRGREFENVLKFLGGGQNLKTF